MESFVLDFINSTDPQRSHNDISNALSLLRVKINPELCRNSSSADRIKFFISIFDHLLFCCESDSSSVRISSFTASTSFLSKMVRSYPIEIQKAFSTFATKLVSPRKGSMLIVFMFSYIATFISGLYFDDFFHSVPFYHHIVNCESSIEDFSHIIQNFPNQMSLENYVTILVSFILQYQKTHNSKLLIPIQKIVEKCVLIDENSNVALDEVYKSNEITLIAFIFTTVNVNCDNFDLHDLALNALRKLKTANLSERDDCLLFLSIKSKSFQVKCQLVNSDNNENDVLRVSIDEEFTDLKINEYSNLPYFYSLFLPNSLLLPDRNKDSHSIIAAKFNTIGRILSDKNKIIDVEEYIKLFCNYIINDCDPIQQYQKYKQQNQNSQTDLLNNEYQNEQAEQNDQDGQNIVIIPNYKKNLPYDEDVSSALKSFAVSLPCLITNAKNHLLVHILKSIFRTKITSWMHGLDILKVIESLKNALLDYIPLTDRLSLLLEFSMNLSEKLSSQAIKLIVEMTSQNYSTYSSHFMVISNFDHVTMHVAKSIDFFSSQSLIINLRILAEIIKENSEQNRNHLEWVASILSTIYQDYITDLHTLSEIFNFLQFFPNASPAITIQLNQNIISMNEKLIDISFSILIYSLFHMKGCDYMNKVSNEYSFYSGLVEKYLNSKSIDIVSDHPFDFKLNFPLISNAFAFYISQCSTEITSSSRKKTLLFLIEVFFEYFPSESTACLFKIDEILQLSITTTEFPQFLDTSISSTFYSTPSYSIVLNSPLLATYSSVAHSLVVYLFSKLNIVNDPHVFAVWAKNFPKNESLVKYAIYFLEHSSHINGSVLCANDFDTFSYFLHCFGIKYEDVISSSLIKIDSSISADYILLALSHSDFILKYNKEINMNSAAFRENFDNMEDKFKMEYIKKYIIFENLEKRKFFSKSEKKDENKNAFHVVITKSLIDYGIEHLNGWEKMAFLLKCQEKLSKQQKGPKIEFEFKDIPAKDRAFNTFFKMNIKDRIQSILQFYIYLNEPDWIEHILRLSVIKGQTLDFYDKDMSNAISSSSEALIIISKFIKKRNKILKRQKQTNNVKIPMKVKPPFNANLYINYLYSKEFVRKREILQVYQFINLIDSESSIIFDFYRKFHSTHVKSNLALLSGFVSHIRTIQKKSPENKKLALDSDFVDFFFKSIQKDANEENIGYASIAAYLVTSTYLSIIKYDSENNSKSCFSEENMLAIRHLFGMCGLNSVELSTLYSTMIAVIFESNGIKKKNGDEIELSSITETSSSIKENENISTFSNDQIIDDIDNNINDTDNSAINGNVNNDNSNTNDDNDNANNNDSNNMNNNNDSNTNNDDNNSTISNEKDSINNNENINDNNNTRDNKNENDKNDDKNENKNDKNDDKNDNNNNGDGDNKKNLDSSKQTNSVVVNDLNEALNHFIHGEMPSQMQAAIRILSRAISSMRERSIEIIEPVLEDLITRTIQFCSPSLSANSVSIYTFANSSSNNLSSSDFLTSNVDVVLKFSRCGHCPFIALNVSKLLRTILQSRAFLKLYPIIASNSIRLCEISYKFANNLIGILIKRLHQTEQLYSVYCKICTALLDSKSTILSGKSNNNYLSIDDLYFFIDCFAGQVKKIEDEQKRESYLLNYVYSFIQNFKGYDNWALFDVYLAWLDFIEKNLEIDDIDHIYEILLKIITEQFIPNSPRFFPIFAVFAMKAIKYLSIQSDDQHVIEKKKKIFEKAIDNAVSLTQNDAHIYALKSLKEGDDLKEALDIAQLEIDD
ncbi:hypothetical protein M9Y10_001769 [Tritrichomonas musculus]|uniref:Non-specific serine/threonine protein kinase n=1 Tax=Tritrichomonas musculus TaxID=1915356 RepID=A0ABR2L7Y8_9EUKA